MAYIANKEIEYTRFRYQQTSSPSADIVTVIGAKDFARHDETGDATYDDRQTRMFRNLIDTAIDRFQFHTGRQIRVSDFTATLDFTPSVSWLWLKQRPLVSIDKIYSIDADDTEIEMDSGDYEFDEEYSKVIGCDWPTITKDIGSFNIEYKSGLATQFDGTVNATASIGATTIAIKDLTAVPGSTGVITLTSSAARESLDFTSWTVAAGVYTFVLETALVNAFAEDDTASTVSAQQSVRTFILQTVAFWYDVRMSGGDHNINTYPGHAQSLLNQHKTRRL